MLHSEDWGEWDGERKRCTARDTEGFNKDLTALEAHIKTLREVCPKDKAGFPVSTALNHIGRLTREFNRFKNYLALHGS